MHSVGLNFETKYGYVRPTLASRSNNKLHFSKFCSTKRLDGWKKDFADACFELNFGFITGGTGGHVSELKSGPGFPWNLCWRTKEEMLAAWPDFEKFALAWFHGHPDQLLFWRNFDKSEILDEEKVKAHLARNICGSDFLFLVNQLYYNKDLNDKFYSYTFERGVVPGFTKYYGGGWALATYLLALEIFQERDFSKYDAHLLEDAMEAVARFRARHTVCPVGMQELIHRNKVHAHMVFDDGVVVQKCHGNPSGSGDTTADNTMAHFWMLYYWMAGEFETPAECLSYLSKNYRPAFYADDSIESMSRDFAERFPISWFEAKAAETNQLIKPGSCRRSESLEGHTFLGGTFRQKNGAWILQPNSERTIASLVVYKGPPSQALRVATWQSALLEAAWDDPLFSAVSSLLKGANQAVPDQGLVQQMYLFK